MTSWNFRHLTTTFKRYANWRTSWPGAAVGTIKVLSKRGFPFKPTNRSLITHWWIGLHQLQRLTPFFMAFQHPRATNRKPVESGHDEKWGAWRWRQEGVELGGEGLLRDGGKEHCGGTVQENKQEINGWAVDVCFDLCGRSWYQKAYKNEAKILHQLGSSHLSLTNIQSFDQSGWRVIYSGNPFLMSAAIKAKYQTLTSSLYFNVAVCCKESLLDWGFWIFLWTKGAICITFGSAILWWGINQPRLVNQHKTNQSF